MLVTELIARKRDGAELSPSELTNFLEAYQRGEVEDYQVSAFLMAVFFRGLSPDELRAMTRAMIASGERLDFRSDGGPPAVDKHSTGGVGDKVSLVLAPLLAELGYRVPMMSGRGLGHTGGTVDKLESIPGFRTGLDLEEFQAVLADVGCAMIRQTPRIAPLDGRLYALRDVTGTVPSIPLIAASIISKKVAEGIEALVLDVKVGRGAFMRDPARAKELARTLVKLAGCEGLRASALLTGMDEPLGVLVGNALEVREAIRCLSGEGPPDLREVTLALCTEAAASVGADRAEARASLTAALDGGTALERFRRLVERQGGDPRIVEDPDRLPSAPGRIAVPAPRSGFVQVVDAREIGLAAVELGAGRKRVDDEVDPGVGIEVLCRVGEEVTEGDTLAVLHVRTPSAAGAEVRVSSAIKIGDAPPDAPLPLLSKRIAADGTEEPIEARS